MKTQIAIIPKLGDLRVYWITNVPNTAKYYPVFSINEACRLIEAIAQEQLENPEVVSNMCGLMKFVGPQPYETENGWEEWEDENGQGINDYSDENEEVWMTNQ